MTPTTTPKSTMSSLEFLTVINDFRLKEGQAMVRNNDFINRIEDECDDLGGCETFVSDNGGTPQRFYTLSDDQMMLVGMRESKAVRKNVLAWVKKLKNVSSVPTWIANLSPQATIAIEDMSKQIEVLADKIQLDAPKVQFVNDFVEHGNSKCFRDVAAILGVKQGFLMDTLRIKKIVYKAGGDWKAYSDYDKHFETKVGVNNWADKITGEPMSKDYTQLRVTAGGLVWLKKRLGVNAPALKAVK